MFKFKRRPSPATAISLLALFIALGSSATAATVIIKNSSQIRAGAVTTSDLANDAVTSNKIADGKVKLQDLGKGLQQEIEGNTEAATALREVYRIEGPTNVGASNGARVLTMSNIEPGRYTFVAKVTLAAEPRGGLFGQGNSAGGHCELHVGETEATEAIDNSYTFLASPGASAPGSMSMQLSAGFAGVSTAYVRCDVTGAPWSAADATILAIPSEVGSREAVNG